MRYCEDSKREFQAIKVHLRYFAPVGRCTPDSGVLITLFH